MTAIERNAVRDELGITVRHQWNAHAGKKPAELVKEFGCHRTSILGWVRLADQASGVVPTQSGALCAAELQELIELRRKLRQVQMERYILAKATAWFANNGDKTSTPSMR